MTKRKKISSIEKNITIDEYLDICNSENEWSTSEVRKLKELVERDNVTQIIFSFGIECTLCVLSFYELKENYEKCAIIKRRIDTHNKIMNTEYQTHL